MRKIVLLVAALVFVVVAGVVSVAAVVTGGPSEADCKEALRADYAKAMADPTYQSPGTALELCRGLDPALVGQLAIEVMQEAFNG